MSSIIKQTAPNFALPEWRNLGTILRILLSVNARSGDYCVCPGPCISRVCRRMDLPAGFIEPHLLLQLALLWLLAGWLDRMTYWTAAAVVLALGIAVRVAVQMAIGAVLRQGTPAVLRPRRVHADRHGAPPGLLPPAARALSPAITESRLQALQARIRPHFLFNSINSVLSLVRTDPRRAEEALHDMADLFRVTMRDNRDLAPLVDEVELCRQYLELEKLRLGERLVVDWNVKSMPLDALAPPLMLQPLVENAVYHGIEPSSSPGTLSINIFLSRAEIHAILRNPYRARGPRHQTGNRMALDNIRERLALHFDAEASLESRVLPDAYEVHIRLPYRTLAPPQPAERNEPRIARGQPGERDGVPRLALAHAGRDG